MKKHKTPIRILITLISGIIIVWALYTLSQKINDQHGNFIRLFPPHVILRSETRDVIYNSYYIAGMDSTSLYLGNTTAPLHLLKTDVVSRDTSHIRLNITSAIPHPLKNARVFVTPPDLYIADGITPVILKGSIANGKVIPYIRKPAYFTAIVPIRSGDFILKSINQKRQNTLGKLSSSPVHVSFFPDILEKQVDGLFCTDGTLHYNKKTDQVVYVYRYRNQFLVTDPSLHLLYKGNTIDTVQSAQVKVAEIPSENSITLAAPPLVVNAGSSVDDTRLFVHSGLRARNEDKETFARTSVIDVYHLKDGSYSFSFHLPPYRGKKAKEFRVSGHRLIALYGHFLVTYDLNPEYFR